MAFSIEARMPYTSAARDDLREGAKTDLRVSALSVLLFVFFQTCVHSPKHVHPRSSTDSGARVRAHVRSFELSQPPEKSVPSTNIILSPDQAINKFG